MYSETTRSIKVTVRPFYLEQHSSPAENHYVWAYHVRIENGGSETVQLRQPPLGDHRQFRPAAGSARSGRGRRAAGARAGRELRIHQQLPAADAVRLHGRRLRDGNREAARISSCGFPPSRSTRRRQRAAELRRRAVTTDPTQRNGAICPVAGTSAAGAVSLEERRSMATAVDTQRPRAAEGNVQQIRGRQQPVTRAPTVARGGARGGAHADPLGRRRSRRARACSARPTGWCAPTPSSSAATTRTRWRCCSAPSRRSTGMTRSSC